MEFPALVRRIERRIAAGALPREQPRPIIAGYGQNRRCDGCDEIVFARQVEYVLELRDRGTFRLHAGCYGLWDVTRRSPGWSRRTPPEQPPVTVRRRIVIIEDDLDNAAMLRSLLEIEGHAVEVAPDGERGIDLVERQAPDLALVNIVLPRIDGYEVARRIRASGETLYLVAVTGLGREQDRLRALEAGFDFLVLKPGDPDDLARLVASSPRRPGMGEYPPGA